MVRVVVGIPACDEEATIGPVIREAQEYSEQVIVVDDGSIDDTATIAAKLGAVILSHETNLGYGAALRTIFNAVRYSLREGGILVTLDADGQHDPSEIQDVTIPLLRGEADIVIGSRFLSTSKSNVPGLRKIGIKSVNVVLKAIAGLDLTDSQSGFRAYNAKAVQLIEPSQTGMGASTEILRLAAKHNLRVLEVPISCEYSELKYSSQSSITHEMDVIGGILQIGLEKGIKWIFLLGCLALFVSIGFGLKAVDHYARTRYLIPNYTIIALVSMLMSQLLIFTSITLHSLNMVKEALLRSEAK